MLRGEGDQPNPYVPIFVDDNPNDRAEIGRERSMLRAAFLGFAYSHLVVIAGSPLLCAVAGARRPLAYPPGVLLFGFEGMKAAFATVGLLYIFVVPALTVSAFGIVNGIVVNYWQSHRAEAFLLWCSAIDLLAVTWIVLASR